MFQILQSALWLIASEFHCGMTIIAFFEPVTGNQRAFIWLFSGNGVSTGEVNRRNVPIWLACFRSTPDRECFRSGGP